MEPFEYAIKKDVRNNAVMRELDHRRHRELWGWVGVIGVAVIVLLFWTWQRFAHLEHGYGLGRVELERTVAEETRRQLRLEYEMLRAPKRIEALALSRLRLVPPSRENTVILERVQPSDPPPASVVARR